MVFTRGSSEEYDRIANISGSNVWKWSNLVPWVLKVLSFVCRSHVLCLINESEREARRVR